MGSKPKK